MEEVPASLVYFRGPVRTIAFARDASGATPGRDFIASLAKGDRAKVDAVLIEALAKCGEVIRNPSRFKQIEGHGNLFEVKAHQLRLAMFRDGATWWILTGHWKQQDRWKKAELTRAERLRDEHMAWLANNRSRKVR